MNSNLDPLSENPATGSALRPENLPDFIVFGAAKSGTSAFHNALSKHPRVFCSNPKEPHYFSYPEILSRATGILETDIHTESAYRSLFSSADESQIRGESSIGYLKNPKTPGRIYQCIPNVKLIAILRQPVDRAYSGWLHRRHNFIEPITDFLTACESRATSDWKRSGNYLNDGYYARHLKNWFSVFPREQFKIFLYEDWQHNPEKVLNETFQFLGIPQLPVITVTRDNVTSISPRSVLLKKFLKPSPHLRPLIRSIIPAIVRYHITKFLHRVNQGQSAPPLDPLVRTKLTAGYETDICELETLIQRDLTHWRTNAVLPEK
jgi:hypothetical protein